MASCDNEGRDYRELVRAIVSQAEALERGDHTAPRYAVVKLLEHNVATLVAWTVDDR